MDTLDAMDDGWLGCKRRTLAAIELETRAIAMGRVERIADGIAFVSGLPDVALDEMVEIECGVIGYVHSLDADVASVVMLDSGGAVQAGMRVTRKNTVLDVPVGESLLGRVVDPLGRPLDGGETIDAQSRLPIERPAPAIVDRDFVSEPLETGVLIVDALFAIGRGQRELIIGDRATGKTSLAIETIVNQRHSGVICVYVAVGQRSTAVQRAIEAIRQYGAPERCIVVVASSASPPGLQWIAPFAGFSIAEFFRDRGQHALVVIDDLSKHAATHRELALLTREPPGREAYPGDIFYLHARLLERAARLSAGLGGGSLTALPIAETDAGNLSAYIPTNLISITDGQIVLDAGLFAANQRPAVDVGLSVSRVGGKAQYPALRDVAGRLRLAYAQFLELEVFSRFGGLADARVTAQVERGKRIRALFAQPRFSALRCIDQVALLAALADGLFDRLPIEAIARVRQRLVASESVRGLAGDLHGAGVLSGPFDEALRRRLIDALREIIQGMNHQSNGDATPRERADDQPAQ
jgi:F-type H+-transporting ATPase subunit alpha